MMIKMICVFITEISKSIIQTIPHQERLISTQFPSQKRQNQLFKFDPITCNPNSNNNNKIPESTSYKVVVPALWVLCKPLHGLPHGPHQYPNCKSLVIP